MSNDKNILEKSPMELIGDYVKKAIEVRDQYLAAGNAIIVYDVMSRSYIDQYKGKFEGWTLGNCALFVCGVKGGLKQGIQHIQESDNFIHKPSSMTNVPEYYSGANLNGFHSFWVDNVCYYDGWNFKPRLIAKPQRVFDAPHNSQRILNDPLHVLVWQYINNIGWEELLEDLENMEWINERD